ncbi:MAG TPA: hypothetical protein DCZ61_03365 [Lachnospiraceae bacterium]|nr:hypothetical protein [Lachnospiraceae bacterium]
MHDVSSPFTAVQIAPSFDRCCTGSGAPKSPGAFLPACRAQTFFGNFRYLRPVFILLFPSGKRKRKNADETAGIIRPWSSAFYQ